MKIEFGVGLDWIGLDWIVLLREGRGGEGRGEEGGERFCGILFIYLFHYGLVG